jgi:hypothetical protein
MNETMIERLARGLDELAVQGDREAGGPVDSFADARKLLESMIEPTPDMIEEGAQIVPGADPALHSEVAVDVWRAMMRAALVA